MHDISLFGNFSEACYRQLRIFGNDGNTVFHDLRGSGGGAKVAFLLAADDIKRDIEKDYGPFPDNAKLGSTYSKEEKGFSLRETSLLLLEIARKAFFEENGFASPEGKWCVQIVRRVRSGARRVGPRSAGPEWRMLMKLERDAKELPRRAGHLPIVFPEYDFWDGPPPKATGVHFPLQIMK